jgi:large subunit ribosomal protein L17
MRHRKHTSKLNRTSEHRAAMMRNLAIALVLHERIHTTHVKANNLRPFVESLVTLGKQGTLAARRLAISYVVDRDTVHKLFTEIAPRVATRNGGYLRIVKDGPRMGDGAPMAYIEFVDQAPKGDQPQAKPDLKSRLKKARHERRKEMAKAGR